MGRSDFFKAREYEITGPWAAPNADRRADQRLQLACAFRRIVFQITARVRNSRENPEYAENARLRRVDSV